MIVCDFCKNLYSFAGCGVGVYCRFINCQINDVQVVIDTEEIAEACIMVVSCVCDH